MLDGERKEEKQDRNRGRGDGGVTEDRRRAYDERAVMQLAVSTMYTHTSTSCTRIDIYPSGVNDETEKNFSRWVGAGSHKLKKREVERARNVLVHAWRIGIYHSDADSTSEDETFT